MRIVLGGIFYPVAMLRYFEAALRRRPDVELFTVGPYTGSWIPWNGGMHLPAKYAHSPDLPLSYNDGFFSPVPIGFIENQLSWQPDIWLQVDAGWYLRGKPGRGKNIFVATDPHVLDYAAQRRLADIFYCMQTPYMQPGDYYLPYAYDPIWHAPEEQMQHYDICLIGLHYSQRNRLIGELRDRGLRIYYDLGPAFDEARVLYNQAPIGLNWSSKNDLTARVFELLGMARLAIVNRVPDLSRFFMDGKHLVVFDTLEEAVQKVIYYHEHPDEAGRIAGAGHRQVGPHTWDARVEQILNEL